MGGGVTLAWPATPGSCRADATRGVGRSCRRGCCAGVLALARASASVSCLASDGDPAGPDGGERGEPGRDRGDAASSSLADVHGCRLSKPRLSAACAGGQRRLWAQLRPGRGRRIRSARGSLARYAGARRDDVPGRSARHARARRPRRRRAESRAAGGRSDPGRLEGRPRPVVLLAGAARRSPLGRARSGERRKARKSSCGWRPMPTSCSRTCVPASWPASVSTGRRCEPASRGSSRVPSPASIADDELAGISATDGPVQAWMGAVELMEGWSGVALPMPVQLGDVAGGAVRRARGAGGAGRPRRAPASARTIQVSLAGALRQWLAVTDRSGTLALAGHAGADRQRRRPFPRPDPDAVRRRAAAGAGARSEHPARGHRGRRPLGLTAGEPAAVVARKALGGGHSRGAGAPARRRRPAPAMDDRRRAAAARSARRPRSARNTVRAGCDAR